MRLDRKWNGAKHRSRHFAPYFIHDDHPALVVVVQAFQPQERRARSQLFLNPQKLVVLGNAIRAAHRSGLDLAHARGHRQVGDKRILGLAAAVRDHSRITVPAAQLDRLQRLRQRADLVHFDQDGVGHALFDAALQQLDVGAEDVVAHKLDAAAELVGEDLPALPVVLGQAVFKETIGYCRIQFS